MNKYLPEKDISELGRKPSEICEASKSASQVLQLFCAEMQYYVRYTDQSDVVDRLKQWIPELEAWCKQGDCGDGPLLSLPGLADAEPVLLNYDVTGQGSLVQSDRRAG